ncbi:MAG: hypothetical protein JKY48_15575 [Flavobacteriales bacterium]|nr:hypothetical protein [Flavobacteriales bacterium]
MKNLSILILTIVFLVFTGNLEAQKRETRVVKGKRGKTLIVHKTKKGAVRAQKLNRKRVKRTRVAHHHYRHLPKRGAVVKNIHRKALSINYKGIGFRYHAGIWYKPVYSEWKIVRPLRGIRIRTLPLGYRKFNMGQSVFYYYYGTYYSKQNEEYEVVDAPLGAEIDSLPEGYETISVAGENYYELDGSYYMPSVNDEGEEVSVAVPNPNNE